MWRLATALLLLVATGCSAPQAAPEGGRAQDDTTVEIVTFAFEPETLEVEPGTTVAFVNRDDILHTVTSGKPKRQGVPGVSADRAARPDGMFDEDLEIDDSFTFTFEEPGSITYYCDIHSGMRGRITVV
jgi:plastocyanin